MADSPEVETNDQRKEWLTSLRDPIARLPEKEFASFLERACDEFEILHRLIRHDLTITESIAEQPTEGLISADANLPPRRRRRMTVTRVRSRITKALALAFLFDVSRAYRICEHAAQSLKIPREERRLFLKELRPVITVRDVNEHGADPKTTSHKKSHPRLHIHESSNLHLALTETGMIIIGDKTILMGPVNLLDVYRIVNRMRGLAGSEALREKQKSVTVGAQ
jgi:hypothetical protein